MDEAPQELGYTVPSSLKRLAAFCSDVVLFLIASFFALPVTVAVLYFVDVPLDGRVGSVAPICALLLVLVLFSLRDGLSRGRGLGKDRCGLRVVYGETGGGCSYAASFLRSLALLVPVEWFLPLFDAKGRRVADRVLGTQVIDEMGDELPPGRVWEGPALCAVCVAVVVIMVPFFTISVYNVLDKQVDTLLEEVASHLAVVDGDYVPIFEKKREERAREDLAKAEKRVSPDHLTLAPILDRIGQACSAQKRYAKAEEALRRSLAIRKKALGPSHPRYALSLRLLAETLTYAGEDVRAEPLAREALDIQIASLGKEHPETLKTMTVLGEACYYQDRVDEAERLYVEVCTIAEKRTKLGAILCKSYDRLALLYHTEGSLPEAEAIYGKLLPFQEKHSGPTSVEVADVLEDYAGLLEEMGREEEAAKLRERAEAIVETSEPIEVPPEFVGEEP